jgi:carboxylesterase type B
MAAVLNNTATHVPVIAWFHGGLFMGGSKTSNPDPRFILNMAEQVGSGAVYVGVNYRLGSFGFLGGSLFNGAINKTAGQTANAGLLDQEMSLYWIFNHIAHWGGDNTKVSIWGPSAGGGSVIHQAILHGGTKTKYFERAYAQSPGYDPRADPAQLDSIYESYLSVAGCPDLNCLVQMQASGNLVGLLTAESAMYGQSVGNFSHIPWGPTVDGDVVPYEPAQAFAGGHYYGIDSIVISNAIHDGVDYISLLGIGGLSASTDFSTFWSKFMPATATQFVASVTSLYPEPTITASYSNASTTLNPSVARLASAIMDEHLACNVFYAQRQGGTKFPIYYALNDFELGSQIAGNGWPTDGRHGSETNVGLFPNLWDTNGQHYLEYLVRHALYGDPNGGTVTASLPHWSLVNAAATTAMPSPAFQFGTFATTANGVDSVHNPAACTVWSSVYGLA